MEDSDKFKEALGLRLVLLREKKFGKVRGSQAACARALKCAPQDWSRLEKAKRGIPNTETLLDWAEFFRCDAGWLLTGEGEAFPHASTASVRFRVPPHAGDTDPDQATERPRLEIAVLDAAAADSTGGRVILDEVRTDEPYELPDTVTMMRVHGDSMQPLAWEGQYVLLASPDRSATSGDLVVVSSRTRGILFKRIFWVDRPRNKRSCILHSVNPVERIEPIELPEDDLDDIRVVMGVVYE